MDRGTGADGVGTHDGEESLRQWVRVRVRVRDWEGDWDAQHERELGDKRDRAQGCAGGGGGGGTVCFDHVFFGGFFLLAKVSLLAEYCSEDFSRGDKHGMGAGVICTCMHDGIV